MLQKPLIKLRDLKDLQSSQKQKADHDDFITPFKVKKHRRSRTTPAKTKKHSSPPVDDVKPLQPVAEAAAEPVPATPKTTTVKRSSKSSRKEPPPSQLRIHSFFKTCEKTFKIEPLKAEPPSPYARKAATEHKLRRTAPASTSKNSTARKRPGKMGRKRLFVDEETSESEVELTSAGNGDNDVEWKPKQEATTVECITILSDSEEEQDIKKENDIKNITEPSSSVQRKITRSARTVKTGAKGRNSNPSRKSSASDKNTLPPKSVNERDKADKHSPLLDTPGDGSKTPPTPNTPCIPMPVVIDTPALNAKTPATSKRKPKPCPPYKIIEDTTFAVDAFQFGYVADVTHYFLTHFHADHYIGLTKKFAMPLYMSTITARLVRTFIPLEEEYIHELELNTPVTVNNVEVTALDANHCPGAVMFLFKFIETGKCILHTGDFRAWHGMESEPQFWNNSVHTIYLDTTYISNNYAFCTQYESIDKAKVLMEKFREKHAHQRILYVCGSYVIGKEKFWSAIAEEYSFKVWTESNRGKALHAINDENFNKVLVDDIKIADMHVIAMGKLSYLHLVEYFTAFEHEYDLLLAIRPSGWEKDSKPQYRGKINIIGIEYSEHSSYEEMQRFVKFLKPDKVISTVPVGRDLMKTAIVPEKWYKYDKLHSSSNYQPRIEQFMSKTPKKKSSIRLPNEQMGGLEKFVSPLKKKNGKAKPEINNNYYEDDALVSIKSSENYTYETLIRQKLTDKAEETKIKEKNSKVNLMVKQENLTNNEHLKKRMNIERTSPRKTKQNPIKQDHTTQDTGSDLIMCQSLQDGESCSVFIPTSGLVHHHVVSRANSSDFFESPNTTKNHSDKDVKHKPVDNSECTNSSEYFESMPSSRVQKSRAKKRLMPEEEIPVSQKRLTRQSSKQNKPTPSPPSTMSEEELEYQLSVLKTIELQTNLVHKNKESFKVSQSNPLLKSSTNSSNRSEETNSDNGVDIENHVSIITDKSEQIPSSQTTMDLANTPRPLRNRIMHSISQMPMSQNEQIPASQTTNDLANTPRPLRNKMKLAYLWQTTERDDIIPASQTSKDLANTPRPIRNKRTKSVNTSSSSASSTSPPKRCKQYERPKRAGPLLEQILEEAGNIDMYDLSQTVQIVTKALSTQKPDQSVDHIPAELLSDNNPQSSSEDFEWHNSNEDQKSVTNTTKNSPEAELQRCPQHKTQSSYPAIDSAIQTKEHDDIIHASQTSKDLACTPRPLRNKRTKSVNTVSSSSSSKRSKEYERPKRAGPLLDQILEEPDNIDRYDLSQTVQTVIKAMSKQKPDQSVDHIPPDFLSDNNPQSSEDSEWDNSNEVQKSVTNTTNNSPKAELQRCPQHKTQSSYPAIDSEQSDTGDDVNVDGRSASISSEPKTLKSYSVYALGTPLTSIDSEEESDLYNTSKMVRLVENVLSQQQPDKSVDHIPVELLDADDDWLE